MKENGFTRKKTRGMRYPTKTIMDADYANELALHVNTFALGESLMHSPEQAG